MKNTGKGYFRSDVFEGMLGLLEDSTLLDTFEALRKKQIIGGTGGDCSNGSGAQTFWYDLDKDGTADAGIAVRTAGSAKEYNLKYTPGNSISGDWCIDVAGALGDEMRGEYYDSVTIGFPVRSVSVTVTPPADGTVVESDEYWNQTNAPEARPGHQEKYIMEDIFAWWSADLDRSGPFTGTMRKGEKYVAYLQIETMDGRDFDDNAKVTVNGEPPVSVEKDEDQPFVLKVFAYIEAGQ